MPFNSLKFGLFLGIVYIFARLLGPQWRWVLLLLASYGFYAALGVPYLLAVLAAVTLVAWGFGLAIAGSTTPKEKQRWLVGGLAIQAGILVVLKYTGFFLENLAAGLRAVGSDIGFATAHPFVSVGVSFFVFQGISYLVDVYLETDPPEKHLGLFALHMALFAKLVQGPIERAGALLPQLHEPRPLDNRDLFEGLRLFFWGLFKKVVVADRLSVIVAGVYSDVHRFHGVSIILATYFFAAQLYLDFSGYTDMARGSARLFGLELTENFRAPYLSASTAEFWRRWHISFSTWILDYIFKPLQIQLRDWRVLGTPIALLITFLVSGLWHGAAWTFIVWGTLHGLFMASSVLWGPWRRKFLKRFGMARSRWLLPLDIILTFHLVCFAWVFFRAASLADAVTLTTNALSGFADSLAAVVHGSLEVVFLGQDRGTILFASLLIAFVAAVRQYSAGIARRFPVVVPWLRSVGYAVMLYLLSFHGADAQTFIYAQF